jgi:hypothetical protein
MPEERVAPPLSAIHASNEGGVEAALEVATRSRDRSAQRFILRT